MTERQFQSQIIMVARANNWRVYHTFDSRRSPAGFPDLVLVGHGRVLFRELKTDKGRMSKPQKEWMQSLIDADADFSVWRPRDLKAIIKELTRK